MNYRVVERWSFAFCLTGFLLATAAGYSVGGRQALAVGYLFGGLAAGIAAIRVSWFGLVVPTEIILFWLFTLWAVATGIFVATERTEFIIIAERLILVTVLLTIVCTYTASVQSPGVTFAAALGLAAVMALAGAVSGELSAASELTELRGQVRGTRVTALTRNPNSLGMICFWGVVALALFGGLSRRMWIKALAVIFAAGLIATIVLSGSRKVFIVLFVFGIAWSYFCFRERIGRRLMTSLAAMLVLLVVGVFTLWILEHTFLGHRINLAIGENGRDGSTETRMFVLREGWIRFLSKPFTGVGLNQTVVLSEVGKYTHSDYLEVLACTGLVGATLYFSTYLLAWRRLKAIYRTTRDVHAKYSAGVCLAAVLSYAIVAFGQVTYVSFESMSVLGGIMGYAYGARRRLNKGVSASNGMMRRVGANVGLPKR